MPVDPNLINYKIIKGGRERIVTEGGAVIAGERVPVTEADGFGYISHFASCKRK